MKSVQMSISTKICLLEFEKALDRIWKCIKRISYTGGKLIGNLLWHERRSFISKTLPKKALGETGQND